MSSISFHVIRIAKITTTSLVFMLWVSCSDSQSVDMLYTISGTISYQNAPQSGVALALVTSSSSSYELIDTTYSSGNGAFTFSDIPEGQYLIEATMESVEGVRIADSYDVVVTGDTELEHLKLPDPLTLFEPLEVTNNTIKLHWSQHQGGNFYEYKIYWGIGTALDDATGNLIHIATSVTDTTFLVDGLSSNTLYSYRVYVNNRFGIVSGSNILQVLTDRYANQESFTTLYSLNEITNFSPPGGILSGVDSDGSYLWLVTVKNVGGYYDNNIVKVIYYDHINGSILKEFEYTDEYSRPYGLAWDGKHVIIAYSATGSGSQKLRFLEPDSGKIIKELSLLYGSQDITYDGTNVLVSYYYNIIEVINPHNGGLVATYNNPMESGANFGIAFRTGEIWLSNKISDQLAIMDTSGTQTGYSTNPVLSGVNGYDSHLHLSFHQNNLVMIKNSRVYIFEINTAQ